MKSIRSSKSGISGSISAASGGEVNQIYTDVGFYKGNMVAIRKIDCGPVILTRENLMELKVVRGMLGILRKMQFKQYHPDSPNMMNSMGTKPWSYDYQHATDMAMVF